MIKPLRENNSVTCLGYVNFAALFIVDELGFSFIEKNEANFIFQQLDARFDFFDFDFDFDCDCDCDCDSFHNAPRAYFINRG